MDPSTAPVQGTHDRRGNDPIYVPNTIDLTDCTTTGIVNTAGDQGTQRDGTGADLVVSTDFR